MKINKYVGRIIICSFMLLSSLIYVKAAGANISGGGNVTVGDVVTVTINTGDSKSWAYIVSVPGNLTLVSGATEPMGFEGDSPVNTLQFKVTSAGSGTVSFSGQVSDGNNDIPVKGDVIFNATVPAPAPEKPSSNSGSNNTSGNSNPQTPAQQETPKEDTRSKDNTLSSLSVEGASLSPEFSSSETSYKVALPAETEKININAKANDNKASVSGTGEKTVKAGENKFSVTVTAENGSEKTYTIVATVDEKPLVYSKYEDKNLGFVRNTEGVTVPKDFKETTVTVDDKEVVAWTNEKLNKTIVYMQDDDNNKQFYLYEDGKITSAFQYRKILGKEVYLIDIPTDKQSITGMTYGELVIDEVTLMGWKFNDPAFENYQLIYVMDMDGNMQYYQYEVTQKTLQLYSQAAAITQATYEKEHESAQTTKTALIASTAIASIIAVASLGYIGFLFYKKKKTL